MNNIMLMADTYADRFYHNRRHHDQSTEYDRAASRAALEAAVTELEKDAKRMDWLDKYAHIATWVDNEPTKLVIDAASGDEFTGDTWREAIDNAMEAK